MSLHESTFDWIQFPGGRARFVGGGRSWDERHHFTFAIDVDGHEYFGEIERRFLPNDNDYNVEVLSFGYRSNTSVGMPMLESCPSFMIAQIKTIETLIVQLIDAGTRFVDRPPILMEFPDAHFMGKVVFREDWALLMDEETAS